MKTLHTVFVGLTLCALLGWTGCQTATTGGSSGSTNDNAANDNSATTNGDTTNSNDNAPDTGTNGATTNGLTTEQEAAVNDAVKNVNNLGAVFAALAAAGISSIADGTFATSQTCPAVSVERGSFTIDYGAGCSPALYPDTTFSGSCTGTVNVAARTITLTFNNFTIYEDVLTNGTVEATVSTEGDAVTFEAQVDLTFEGDDGTGTYYYAHDTGDVTVNVDLSTGEVFIPYADLLAVDQTGDISQVTLENVHIVWYEVLPDAGTCTWVSGAPGAADQIIMVIVFTEDTPTDGTVLVTVNGHGPYVMTLEDVEPAE